MCEARFIGLCWQATKDLLVGGLRGLVLELCLEAQKVLRMFNWEGCLYWGRDYNWKEVWLDISLTICLSGWQFVI